MTQETYDAIYAQNCPECPFNRFDGEYNRCILKSIVHHIFKKKPRWCPYMSDSDEENRRMKEAANAEYKSENLKTQSYPQSKGNDHS